MLQRVSLTLIATLSLAGCLGSTAQPLSQPQPLPQSQPQPQSETGEAMAPEEASVEQSSSSEAAKPAVSEADRGSTTALSNQIDQLMGRLTLVQEQVINQRALAQQQLELSQAILQRVQLMTNTALIDETLPAAQTGAASEGQDAQLDAALNQLLQIANEMQLNGSQGSPDLPWDVASAVTSKGWILVRYRRDTGESWIAEKGSWTLLKEESTLSSGTFSVQLERRDTDSKGYVAVRLDRTTGATWWLNDRTWQAY